MRRRSPHYGPSDRSTDRGADDRVRSNMRMDRKPNATRISGEMRPRPPFLEQRKLTTTLPDPSHPAGKRKEIDNVMKKARQQPTNEYWDKKLLEAEEKDPNRWKHTGYRKMYIPHGNSERKSRSRSPMRKTPLSEPQPRGGPRHIPQSPVRRRISRTPERHKPRSPPPRYNPREMVKPKEVYRGAKRPVSPPPKVSLCAAASYETQMMQFPQAARTPSISSCSDDSCSVCSSDDGRRVIEKSRMPERYHGPMNRMVDTDRLAKKSKLKTALSPKRRHLKRPVSPEKLRRAEPSTPTPTKKKDKTEKVRLRSVFHSNPDLTKTSSIPRFAQGSKLKARSVVARRRQHLKTPPAQVDPSQHSPPPLASPFRSGSEKWRSGTTTASTT